MNYLVNLHKAFLSALVDKGFVSFSNQGVISLMPAEIRGIGGRWVLLTELDNLLIGDPQTMFAKIGSTTIYKKAAINMSLENLLFILEENETALARKVEEELATRRRQPVDTTGFKSWRSLLNEALEWREDEWCDIEHITLTDAELDELFDADNYGAGIQGKPITAWTENWVYFAHSYDGKESIRSVPRNPVNQGCCVDASEPDY